MLMTLMSLAISLFSTQSFYALPQQANGSNQTPQSHRVQQENKDSTQPTVVLNVPLTVSVKPIALPPGDNAWTVQIVSRGGFTGSGRGDVTITSEGILIWSGPDGSCSRKLPDESMQALTKIVLAANTSPNSEGSQLSLTCLDCYVTGMIVQRRRIGSVDSANAVSWDDVSQANIPADAKNIYEAVMAYKGCKL